MEQEKNNQKLSKELNSLEDISITKKIYNFYFFTLRKKDINLFFLHDFICVRNSSVDFVFVFGPAFAELEHERVKNEKDKIIRGRGANNAIAEVHKR